MAGAHATEQDRHYLTDQVGIGNHGHGGGAPGRWRVREGLAGLDQGSERLGGAPPVRMGGHDQGAKRHLDLHPGRRLAHPEHPTGEHLIHAVQPRGPICHHERMRPALRPGPVGIRRVIAIVVVADALVFLVMGANRPRRPVLSPSVTVMAPAARPIGLHPHPGRPLPTTGINMTITGPRAGSVAATHCFMLADTPTKRARGLMGTANLGGFAGMAFVYPAASHDSYYMRDTPLPLQIAFFSGTGAFVSAAAMLPCPATTVSCPLYAAAGPFRLAVEVPLGHLRALGIGPGSTAHLGGPCLA